MFLPLALSAFVLFLGAIVGFIWRGCNPQGKMRRAGPLFLLLAAAAFAVLVYALPRIPPPYPLEELNDFVWVR